MGPRPPPSSPAPPAGDAVAACTVVATKVYGTYGQDNEVRRMVRTESVVVSVLGGVVGLAVGVALGAAFVLSLADDGIDKLGLPVGQLIAAVIFAGLAGVVAALYPARKAAKMDVLRAITVE